MKKLLFILFYFFLCNFLGSHTQTMAQNHAVFNNDLDGDGVGDTGGLDKCPSTLTQIQGKKATTLDEISNKEVIIRLPQDLKKYLYQDRVPLDIEKTKTQNEQGALKRERNKVETGYGKYKDLKTREKKDKIAELDVQIDSLQQKIVAIQEKIKTLDPNSYILFSGNLEDKEGNVLQKNVEVKIRIKVDAFGCLPDDDKDGSPNMVDQCPGEIGTVESSGCPDRDRDGIGDKEDDCPDVKGPKESKGCPDRDKDTVPDVKDDCPDEKGLVELNGCPDRDGDGVPDKKDDCPDEKGQVDLKGCPDRDGDNIIDKQDDCPDDKGLPEYKGCPDRDGDKVIDKQDNCPDVPGTIQNKGCPEILEKASKVEFEFNKAIIKPNWYPVLDELVALLKKYPESKIYLEGHTDSDGTEEDNLTLSINRAKAVADYLTGKGIEGNRISSTGFGEMKPIASNETPAGKAKNRRVDMKLSNK